MSEEGLDFGIEMLDHFKSKTKYQFHCPTLEGGQNLLLIFPYLQAGLRYARWLTDPGACVWELQVLTVCSGAGRVYMSPVLSVLISDFPSYPSGSPL